MGRPGECQVSVFLLNPYSVFPKLFALSLPGACSTILLKMQCKQERKTEKCQMLIKEVEMENKTKTSHPNLALRKQSLASKVACE